MEPVALLVPAYNCQQQLDSTIAELPTDLPLAVLIVDDGSVPPLVLPAAAPCHRVRMIRNAENLGVHGALREGIKLLHAEGFSFVARLDCGDNALSCRFGLQQAFLDAHPEVAVVGTACDIVDDWGRHLYLLRPPVDDANIRRQILLRTCLAHTSVMMRLSAVIEVGNYRGVYPLAEDLDLFLRLLGSYRAANLPQVLTRFAISSDGTSARHRYQQLRSTLRLQVSHARPGSIADWAGIAKTLAHCVVPRSITESAKSFLRAPRLEGSGSQ
ncbi:MAG: glycosyltransferase [Defluviicoccus sp.]|nr:glycosyltransferase [Defluviicoccus sp.]